MVVYAVSRMLKISKLMLANALKVCWMGAYYIWQLLFQSLNTQLFVVNLIGNHFVCRCLYPQWWSGKGGIYSSWGRRRETLENAIRGKLLGVHEVWSSWYGQHWWSSRWCYHCSFVFETGNWSRQSTYYTSSCVFVFIYVLQSLLWWLQVTILAIKSNLHYT